MSQFVGFNWKIFVIVTITVFTILLVNWNTSKTSFVQELNKPRKLSRTDHEHEHSYIHARFSHHYSKPKSRFVYQAPDKGKKTKPGHKSLFIHRQPKFIEIKENVKVFDDAFPQCEFKIVETIPKVLESKGIRSHHISTFNAFLELVQNAQESFAMMSQWAIDGSGKDKYIFKAMEESIKEKYVNMDIGFNNHANFAFQANFSPYHLLSMQNYKGQVNLREPNIEGKITPRHKGNMIHSKIFLTDR